MSVRLSSSSSLTIGTTTISGLTAGSVLFGGTSGVIQQDNANLFWDDTNNRLGIGTNTPSTRVEINTTGIASSTPVMKFTGSVATYGIDLNFHDQSDGGCNINGDGNLRLRSIYSTYFNAVYNDFVFTTEVNGNFIFMSNGTGKMGIGTANPAYKLDVAGDVRFANSAAPTSEYLLITHTAGGTIFSNVGAGNITFDTPGQINFALSGAYKTYLIAGKIGLASDIGLAFSSNINADGTPDIGISRGAAGKLYVGNGTVADYSGTLISSKTGIGTVSPFSKLSFGVSSANRRFALYEASNGTDFYGISLDDGGSTLSLNTNNAEKLSVLANGYVGIGTTSPRGYFDVQGASGNSTFYIGRPGSANGFIISNDSIYFQANYASSGTGDFYFSSASIDLLSMIGSTGRVGINNTSPTELLTLGASAPTTAGARKAIELAPGGFSPPGAYNSACNGDKIILYRSSGGNYDATIGVGSGGDIWYKSSGSSSTAGIQRWLIGSGPTEVMRLNSTGLGVYNDNPDEMLTVGSASESSVNRKAIKLGVGGYAAPGAFSTNSNGDKIIFYNGVDFDGRFGVSNVGDVWLKSISTNGSNQSYGSINFWTGNGASSLANRMRISGTGNVGIGTTDPTAPIHVYGDVNANVGLKFENPNAGNAASTYFLSTDGTHNSYFGMDGAGTGTNRANQGFIYNDTAGVGLYAAGGSGTIKFYTSNGSAGSDSIALSIANNRDISVTTSLSVADDAYASSWNGSTNVPTKNAIYDKIETIASDVLFDHFADANNGTTVETDLYTDTLSAGQLSVNGQKILYQAAGIFVGDATSTQRLKAYFGGTLIFDTGALSIGVTTTNWDLYVTVIRVSSSVVRCSATLTTSFASLNAYASYTEVTGLTLANTQIIKCTGTAAGVTGASNQITAKEGYTEFKPAA